MLNEPIAQSQNIIQPHTLRLPPPQFAERHQRFPMSKLDQDGQEVIHNILRIRLPNGVLHCNSRLIQFGVHGQDLYGPDLYDPDMFSPDLCVPDSCCPDLHGPEFYCPDLYSPDLYSPDL